MQLNSLAVYWNSKSDILGSRLPDDWKVRPHLFMTASVASLSLLIGNIAVENCMLNILPSWQTIWWEQEAMRYLCVKSSLSLVVHPITAKAELQLSMKPGVDMDVPQALINLVLDQFAVSLQKQQVTNFVVWIIILSCTWKTNTKRQSCIHA